MSIRLLSADKSKKKNLKRRRNVAKMFPRRGNYRDVSVFRCVLFINKFSMNYLCLLLPLSGIFPSKSLEP